MRPAVLSSCLACVKVSLSRSSDERSRRPPTVEPSACRAASSISASCETPAPEITLASRLPCFSASPAWQTSSAAESSSSSDQPSLRCSVAGLAARPLPSSASSRVCAAATGGAAGFPYTRRKEERLIGVGRLRSNNPRAPAGAVSILGPWSGGSPFIGSSSSRTRRSSSIPASRSSAAATTPGSRQSCTA